jgi:arsenate reductase
VLRAGCGREAARGLLLGAVVENRIYNVLFLCTGNSARSVLAEGMLNHFGGAHFRAFSAGSHPNGTVNPHALATLQDLEISGSGFRSKSWDEFAAPDAPRMDFIFTVCDSAAGEACPFWPGTPATAHWGVPDPAAVEGSDEEKRRAFSAAAAALKRRIELFLALPLPKLDAMSLRNELSKIGKQ